MDTKPFPELYRNDRPDKPRTTGITEVRGPYLTPTGPNQLADLLQMMGEYIDIYKFACGSFLLLDSDTLQEMIEMCHEYDVMVSTGGYIENVLLRENDAVEHYLNEAAEFGFDIVEISSGYISIPNDDLIQLTELVEETGMKAKPEIDMGKELLEEEIDPSLAIDEAKQHLDAGAYKIMVEGEGITEEVEEIRTDIIFEICDEVGLENCVFEAPERDMFEWFIRTFGPDVNLFIDSSQIVQLEVLRSGLWGSENTWGKIVTYPE